MLLTGKMENKMPNIEKVKTVIGKPYDEVTKFLVDKSYHFIICKTEPNAEPEIFQWDKEENSFYNLNGYIWKSYFENHWLYLGQVMCPNLVDPFKFMIDTKEIPCRNTSGISTPTVKYLVQNGQPGDDGK